MQMHSLTSGPVLPVMLRFAVPMILGNLLQQCYNVADTLIVGRFLGADALAAVGSAYTLMTFLTSILLGLCLGSGALFSARFGQKDMPGLRRAAAASFGLIALLTAVLTAGVYLLQKPIIGFLQAPSGIDVLMYDYLHVIYAGLAATFLYNYFASLLRSVGNSAVPLVFLAVSAVLNIVLDLVFVLVFHRGVAGAAEATVLSQYVSGAGLAVYTLVKYPALCPRGRDWAVRPADLRVITSYSLLTCVQQSVMNLGILAVQGLVNSFGATVMAAFAAAVKIDSFAYMPVQDFGNAFSFFIAQNYGAGETKRIKKGLKGAVAVAGGFSLAVSVIVFVFAAPLMQLFVGAQETAVIAEGVRYLRIEGAFYCCIGCLFLLYGLYRALGRPGMSVVLTVISLGTRVALAYLLSATPLGVTGIWWSVPIGWVLADVAGLVYYACKKKKLLPTVSPKNAGQ